jgi:uncharacterized membrane protein YeaQ/YmgE (transglycosylase-associated protein family)
MSFLVYLVVLLAVGFVVGGLGRLALPGRDPMSVPMTIAVGVGGSLIGGIVGRVLFGSTGLIFSVAGAALIVYFIRRSRGGGLSHPGAVD